jgi:hypothetical protein
MHADSHDLFLAHAGADRAAAEELFDLLAPDVRVWLDTRSLMLGDEWPVEIPRAQRAAVATVILASRSADHAYYLRDEIHTAVALHRSFPDEHRAVAVFLDGRPADPMQVPYGLRILNSLDAIAEGGSKAWRASSASSSGSSALAASPRPRRPRRRPGRRSTTRSASSPSEPRSTR